MAPVGLYLELSSNSKNKQTKQKQCTVTREFAKELLVYQFISVWVVRSSLFALGLSFFLK